MSGSSFSIATTVFVSLAICAIISYGVFYYFKQRMTVIEQSQMEQARIMQAIISRGLAQAHEHSKAPPQEPPHAQLQQPAQQPHYDKEITITQSGLIEVSSDEESDSDSSSSASASASASTSASDSTDSEEEDKWSIGDEIHQPESYHKEFDERFKKNIILDAICIDGSHLVESVDIEHEAVVENGSNKKIISLNKDALGSDNADSDDASDDESSSSSSEEEVHNKTSANELDSDLNLKIGYTKHKKEPLHLNYGNMSVPALRQLAKERGLGGDDADLQKLKKKDLVQLLQWSINFSK